MDNIKSMLIILIIVGVLCTGFYFYGKSHAKEINIKDTDTLVITKKDTIKISVERIVETKDTIIVIHGDTIHYDFAEFDTTLVEDSSSVDIHITYDEYFNRFSLVGSYYPFTRTIIINKTTELSPKLSFVYGHISALSDKKNILIDVDGGIILKNRYHIGITGNTLGYAGIQFGGEF